MYEKWLKNPVRFVAMTGYCIEQFSLLLPYFEYAHQHYFSRYNLSGKKKKALREFVIRDLLFVPLYIISECRINPFFT